MKIDIITIGKTKDEFIKAQFSKYKNRIPWKINLKELAVETKQQNAKKIQFLETQKLVLTTTKKQILIFLDESGTEVSSLQFAEKIIDWQNQGKSNLAFLIGGAYGLNKEFFKKGHFALSLSKMTWPHQMVRTMLIEQIYRTYTIISGHPYHKD